MSSTPYTEDALRIRSDTEPDEIYSFVENRTRDPIEVGGVTIFNYSTHQVDHDALLDVLPNLKRDVYLIPFQLGPVWAYMTRVIPDEVLEAEYLMYNTDSNEYHPHKNFFRVADSLEDRNVSFGLSRWLENCDLDFENDWVGPAQQSISGRTCD